MAEKLVWQDPLDEIVWNDDEKVNAEWYAALQAIDERGDKQPLVRLLQRGQVPPPRIAFYIGDLLDRYALKQGRGKPRTPAYARTPEQLKLIQGVIYAHKLVHRDGVDLPVALAEVAAEFRLSEETLSKAYAGKHGGLRRAKQNWYRP
jgi:hypothetical protein